MANFNHLGKAATLTLMGAMGVALPFNAMAAESIEAALKDSKTKLSLRPRYESVEVTDDTAEAFTLKTRLTFTTGSFYDTSAVLEFDDVTSLKSVDYDDGLAPGTGSTIADPEGTEVNQAYLSYKGLDSTDFKWGRQRILLDNQRFVGGVGWRQNEQTYDSFSIGNTSVGNLAIFYAHISNVNRIFGEQAVDLPVPRLGDHNHDTHLLNVGYTFDGIGKLSGYYYDLENETAQALSSKTYGVRFAGATSFDSFKLGYELEYADQEESGDNPDSYSADYMLFGISGTLSGFTLGIAQETLGADTEANKSFATTLATLHKFQGWADKFLLTPATGIEDTYITFKAGLPWGMKFIAVYHDFESAENVTGESDFGSEIDAAITKKFKNGASLQLKYADFSGEEESANPGSQTDVTKIWVTATYAI
ncbi:MAG: alginate export family protein [Pseudomonadales bacterium]|nr:alginate export family protein [Pseudomonadales bacterium]